jgi:hypothetical protein
LKLLLRLFLATGGTYGGVMGLIAGLAVSGQGVEFALFVGVCAALFAGTLFGGMMALVMGGLHVLAVRRLGHRLTDETLAVRQRRRLTLGTPFSEAFGLCLESIRHLGNMDVEEETDYSAGVILASKRWSWLSAGECLRFELLGRGEQTDVQIECRPRVRTAIVDLASSLRTADAIVGFLLAHGPDAEGAFAAKPSDQVRASSDRVRQGEDGLSPTS